MKYIIIICVLLLSIHNIKAQTKDTSKIFKPKTFKVSDDTDVMKSLPASPKMTSAPQVIMYVEKMPTFPGGEQKLQKYLKTNINYPTEANAQKLKGVVYLEFIVNEDGSLSDIKVLRDIGGGCGQEAVRLVKSMPKWKPGLQNGAPVKVRYILPVAFHFNGSY